MVRSKFLMYFIYLGIGVAIASIGYFFFKNDKDDLTQKAGAIVIEKRPAVNDSEKNLLLFKVNERIISTDNNDLYSIFQEGDSAIIQYKEVLNSKQEVVDVRFITGEKINR